MFGKIWRGLIVLALILYGAYALLCGIGLALVSHRLHKPPDVPSWGFVIAISLVLGVALLLLAAYLSRRWNQPFWLRFNLVSLFVAVTAGCVVLSLLIRPPEILSRTLEPRVAEYEIKSPGWPALGPYTLIVREHLADDLTETDQRALEQAFQLYYGTDERVGADLLRGILIVLGSLYGTEALIAAIRRMSRKRERQDAV